MKKKIVISLLTIVMTFLSACTNIDDIESRSHPSEKQQQLDSIQESLQPDNQEMHSQEQESMAQEFKVANSRDTTADINGDGVEEKINVTDYRKMESGYAKEGYTQVSAEFTDSSSIQIDFSGYWNSTIIPGDLNGDGAEEIVLVRWSSISPYGFGNVTILHAENGMWEKYENLLIQNPLYDGCPANFFEENLLISPLGGTIVENEKGQKLLRIILPEGDIDNGIVRCIDCLYQEEGWYIEKVQIVSDFYGENDICKLLNLDDSYNYIR